MALSVDYPWPLISTPVHCADSDGVTKYYAVGDTRKDVAKLVEVLDLEVDGIARWQEAVSVTDDRLHGAVAVAIQRGFVTVQE